MAYQGYQNLRVLIVDDFENFRLAVSKMIQDLGVERVDMVVHANMALERCQDHKYDLILCDYNLGGGKNGLEMLEEMRHRNLLSEQSLFVLVSAESSKAIVLAASDAEPDAYLTKPITGKTLEQRLNRLLVQRDEIKSIKSAIGDQQWDVAIERCRTKIQEGGRYANLCQKMVGELFLQLERFEEAEGVYQQVLESRPLDWAKVGLARVRSARGDSQTAAKWLKEIIATNPLCMSAYDALEDVYCREDEQEQVQSVLEQAVSVSPMAFQRQQRLADVAESNNDMECAAQAYRRTVKLGEYSCFDKRDNHLNFCRTTAALLKEEDDLSADLPKEALRVIANVSNRFEREAETNVQALCLEAQLNVGLGSKKRAEELFADVRKSIEGGDMLLEIDTELDYVQTIQSMGQPQEAETYLKSLIQRYKDDQYALEKIDRLLEEPMSEANRKKVAALNRDGIGFYQAKQYNDAIRCFKNAKRLFPNHVGVHLNLVQALQGEMEEFGTKRDLLELCLTTLKKVDKKTSAEHPQYTRYRQLQEKIRQLGRAV